MRDETTEDIMMRNQKLTLENELLRKERDEARHQKLTLENELLRKERDEARRLYCEELAYTIQLERGDTEQPHDLAEEKNWDCYKGNS